MKLIPAFLEGPLRVGSQEATVNILLGEPLLFAAHYANLAGALSWPDEIDGMIEAVRKRYDTHDEVLNLMDTLRGQVAMPLSIELTRRMVEGLEIHARVRRMPETFRHACRKAGEALALMQEGGDPGDGRSASGRLARLAQLVGFSPAESRLLGFALALSLFPDLQCFTRLFVGHRQTRAQIWPVLLDLTLPEISATLSPHGRLVGSGLLQEREGIPRLPDFWVELLVKITLGFDEQIIQPLAEQQTPAGTARLPAVDCEILNSLLARREPGINVLLHGKASVDKLRLARNLVGEAQGTAYDLAPEIPPEERAAALMLAQGLLARYPDTPILVVEKAAAVLTRSTPQSLQHPRQRRAQSRVHMSLSIPEFACGYSIN